MTSNSPNDPFSTRTEAFLSAPTAAPQLQRLCLFSSVLIFPLLFAFCYCYSAPGCKITVSLGINKEMHPSILVNSPEHTLYWCVFMEEAANCSVILEIC